MGRYEQHWISTIGVISLYYNSLFVTQIHLSYYMWWIQPDFVWEVIFYARQWVSENDRRSISLYHYSAFITQIEGLSYKEHNRGYSLHHGWFPLFQPLNDLANACIKYRRDRVAWCVWVILQREIITPGVIPLYHRITPHMSVWDSLNNVR